MHLGIIDLETGNIASLIAAIKKLNLNFKIIKTNLDFQYIDKIILPGVGAYKDFMTKINDRQISNILKSKIKMGIPFLGICVGFQVLFEKSNEFGESKGLALLDGEIKSFNDYSGNIKVPHVGWNECKIKKKSNLFNGIDNNSDFYFTHSYMIQQTSKHDILTETNYEIDFISSINRENIYGVQFHPEKSQANGLKLIKNFHDIC
ncbi:imidazole glycerol phosphate synthase subunit HisH [Candidatus Pelagibacter sp.]|uniref:imidazole glycerol phosphate synthase subunit HisH n=1 Tax=Candidatus Pelagibacter sp. TaxID=2024849 RepID=UPI003F875B5C